MVRWKSGGEGTSRGDKLTGVLNQQMLPRGLETVVADEMEHRTGIGVGAERHMLASGVSRPLSSCSDCTIKEEQRQKERQTIISKSDETAFSYQRNGRNGRNFREETPIEELDREVSQTEREVGNTNDPTAPYNVPCINGLSFSLFQCPYLHVPPEDYYDDDVVGRRMRMRDEKRQRAY